MADGSCRRSKRGNDRRAPRAVSISWPRDAARKCAPDPGATPASDLLVRRASRSRLAERPLLLATARQEGQREASPTTPQVFVPASILPALRDDARRQTQSTRQVLRREVLQRHAAWNTQAAGPAMPALRDAFQRQARGRSVLLATMHQGSLSRAPAKSGSSPPRKRGRVIS